MANNAIWFKAVKRYYNMGLYTKADVATFVIKGRITAEQYELITNEAFEATPNEE